MPHPKRFKSRKPAAPAFDGTKLRQLRAASETTQKALALAAGVGAKDVSRYERGVVQPSLPTFAAIARALGVEAGALLKG